MAKWTIETRKSIPGYPFTNTWHVEAADLEAASLAGTEIIGFEASLMWNGVTFHDFKVSPWPNPTNQDFIIVPVILTGGRTLTNPEPAEMCLLVNIHAATGRTGRKWLRFCLDEGEVALAGKSAALVPAAPVRSVFADAETALQTVLNGSAITLLIGANPATARSGTNNLQIAGVGFRDTDVGWYNRTP